jgi:hypothetical protein
MTMNGLTRDQRLLGTSMMLVLLGSVACGGDQAECARASDCFVGETCINGECVVQTTGDADSGSAVPPGGEPGPPNAPQPDAGTSPGTGDSGGPDEGEDVPGARACVVDKPTTRCEDPETKINNDSMSGVRLNEGRNSGCPTADNLVTVDEVYSGVLCHSEPADWFRLGLVHCNTRTFYVKVSLTPTEACDEDMFHLVVEHYPCEEDRVYCDVAPDGTKIVTIEFTAPPHPVVFGINVGVLPGRVDLGDTRLGIQYGYDLRLEVY